MPGVGGFFFALVYSRCRPLCSCMLCKAMYGRVCEEMGVLACIVKHFEWLISAV